MSAESLEYLPGEITSAQRQNFRSGLRRLLGVNIVSLGLSAVNELVVGHSALGFSQGSMELVDTGLATGLHASEKNDVLKKHIRASRIRQALYGTHIAIAGVGIYEAQRLMSEAAEPSAANIAISGLVGLLNANYLHHRMRHHRHQAHTAAPTYDTAMEDPIEVIQDELHDLPSAEAVHRMNDNGTTAIAWTNVAESAGGFIGACLQVGFSQGGAVAAIASSVAVIGIMGKQTLHEHRLMRAMQPSAA